MRRIHPPRPVQVRRVDTWHVGWLEAWRRDSGGWRAYVRYSVGVGAQHLEWVGGDPSRKRSVAGETIIVAVQAVRAAAGHVGRRLSCSNPAS